jgi:hypothetical protein
MPLQAVFGLSVALGFVTWTLVAAVYLWPALRRLPQAAALRPILLLHSTRFVGMAFIVPGVVSPDIPAGFAEPAAYGDLIAALLALACLAVLRFRWGALLVWVFNLWGSADLLLAFYNGNRFGLLPGQLGAGYFIPTVVVPALLVTHALVFVLLLRKAPACMTGAG